MLPIPGDTFGKYQVVRTLASGSSAQIFEVRHVALKSRHAMKVLVAQTATDRERLKREAQAQAQVRHENIVTVSDVIDVNDAPAMVMQYVDGPNLADWVAENKPGLRERLAVFEGIVQGVREAHRNGMVHRSLNPQEILLEPIAGGWQPKIIDFGMVKLIGHGAARLTATGDLLGNPWYTAPEQIEDSANVDARADIFALGCMLYELVCGHRPFEAAGAFEVIDLIAKGAYEPPDQIVEGLPLDLIAAIEGALETERESRMPLDGMIKSLRRSMDALDPTPSIERRLSQATMDGEGGIRWTPLRVAAASLLGAAIFFGVFAAALAFFGAVLN